MSLKRKDYVLVTLQFSLFLAYVANIKIAAINFDYTVKNTGLILVILGSILLIISVITLNKNLSPFPAPKANGELIEKGPYKYVRHPIYTSVLCCLLGYAFYTNSIYKISVTLLVFVLFLIKYKYEEARLLNTFKDYTNYKKRTGAFLPKIFKN